MFPNRLFINEDCLFLLLVIGAFLLLTVYVSYIGAFFYWQYTYRILVRFSGVNAVVRVLFIPSSGLSPGECPKGCTACKTCNNNKNTNIVCVNNGLLLKPTQYYFLFELAVWAKEKTPKGKVCSDVIPAQTCTLFKAYSWRKVKRIIKHYYKCTALWAVHKCYT